MRESFRSPLYETSSGQLFGQPIEHQGNVFSLTFDPNGRLITASDPTVRFWDVPSLKTARQTTGLGDVIYSVAYGPAGLWSHQEQLMAVQFGLLTRRPVRSWVGLSTMRTVLAYFHDSILFSPDGRYVAAKITRSTARKFGS